MKRSIGRAPLTTVLTLAVTACALGIAAAPAGAVPGLQQRASVISPNNTNSVSPKTAVAYCPSNQRVIGGGGWVQEVGPGATSRKPTLTELRPVRLYNGVQDAYVVSAAETTPGTSNNWWVQAYAMCANPITGMHIEDESTIQSSKASQPTAAVCPSSERVLGSGAKVNIAAPGQAVLHVARPSGPGDIARAQGHEDFDGYGSSWSVTAYAVCVPASSLPGYDVVFWESTQRLSQDTKIAGTLPQDHCPGSTRLQSSGAAITNIAPGHVSLQGIFPYEDARQTQAIAVENTSLSANWDFIVSSGVCAN
jgi:hypothetical protein